MIIRKIFIFVIYFAVLSLLVILHPHVSVADALADSEIQLIPIDLQHLLISRKLNVDDYTWAIDQVSYWMYDHWKDRAPVIWSNDSADLGLFLDGVFETSGDMHGQNDLIRRQVERRRKKGRSPRISRKNWKVVSLA